MPVDWISRAQAEWRPGRGASKGKSLCIFFSPETCSKTIKSMKRPQPIRLTNYSESALAVRGTKNSKLTPPKKKKKNCRGIKKAFPLSAQMIKHFLMLVNAMKI